MPRTHPALPFLAALLGVALFSVMDALMKRASLASGVYTALLLRSLAGTVLMLPLWRASGGRWPAAAVLRVHLLRSAVVAGMAWLFFFSLVRLPMAEAIALSFIAPLIALCLAAVLLGERIRPRALIASLIGLAGVAVIAGARIEAFGTDRQSLLGIAAVLGSALLYAVNLVLQRHQAQLAGPQEVALFQNLCVGGFLALLAPWLAAWPDVRVLGDVTGAATGGGRADAAFLGLCAGRGAGPARHRIYRLRLGGADGLAVVRRGGDHGNTGRGGTDRRGVLGGGAAIGANPKLHPLTFGQSPRIGSPSIPFPRCSILRARVGETQPEKGNPA